MGQIGIVGRIGNLRQPGQLLFTIGFFIGAFHHGHVERCFRPDLEIFTLPGLFQELRGIGIAPQLVQPAPAQQGDMVL